MLISLQRLCDQDVCSGKWPAPQIWNCDSVTSLSMWTTIITVPVATIGMQAWGAEDTTENILPRWHTSTTIISFFMTSHKRILQCLEKFLLIHDSWRQTGSHLEREENTEVCHVMDQHWATHVPLNSFLPWEVLYPKSSCFLFLNSKSGSIIEGICREMEWEKPIGRIPTQVQGKGRMWC